MKKKILVTGGSGFIGSNLSVSLNRDYEVFSVDNLYKKESELNLNSLKSNDINFIEGDITDYKFIKTLISNNNFDSIFHLAAQVAMTKSIDDPVNDFNINTLGTLNLLNAMRENSSTAKFINISSNKVYGDISWDILEEQETRFISKKFKEGYDEDIGIQFSSPYGCSKGSAEQYVLDYSNTYNLNTVSLRLSTIYGRNQHFTFDQGWIGWFINEFLKFQDNPSHIIEVQGNGKQVRDVLNVDDLIDLFIKIINSDFKNFSGQCFNIGGGINNSLSILELLSILSKNSKIESNLKIKENPWRVSDQKFYISNIKKAKKYFNWEPSNNLEENIYSYVSWIQNG